MAESIQLPFISEMYFCYHCDVIVSLKPNTPLICPQCSKECLEKVSEDTDSSSNSFLEEDKETDSSSSEFEYDSFYSESILGGTDSLSHPRITGFVEENHLDRVLPTILEHHPSYSPLAFFDHVLNGMMLCSSLRENMDNIITRLLDENNELGYNELSPLSKDQIESLPIIILSEDHLKKDGQCTICLEDFNVGEKAKSLPCDHFYHENCIVSWLEKQCTCPNCRKKI